MTGDDGSTRTPDCCSHDAQLAEHQPTRGDLWAARKAFDDHLQGPLVLALGCNHRCAGVRFADGAFELCRILCGLRGGPCLLKYLPLRLLVLEGSGIASPCLESRLCLVQPTQECLSARVQYLRRPTGRLCCERSWRAFDARHEGLPISIVQTETRACSESMRTASHRKGSSFRSSQFVRYLALSSTTPRRWARVSSPEARSCVWSRSATPLWVSFPPDAPLTLSESYSAHVTNTVMAQASPGLAERSCWSLQDQTSAAHRLWCALLHQIAMRLGTLSSERVHSEELFLDKSLRRRVGARRWSRRIVS